MVSAERTAAGRFSAVHRSAAQHRILDAGLALIADNGVLPGDVDDDSLRAQLLQLTRRLLAMRE